LGGDYERRQRGEGSRIAFSLGIWGDLTLSKEEVSVRRGTDLIISIRGGGGRRAQEIP